MYPTVNGKNCEGSATFETFLSKLKLSYCWLLMYREMTTIIQNTIINNINTLRIIYFFVKIYQE